MSHPTSTPGTPGTPGTGTDTRPTRTPTGLIALAWTLVGVPLAYGLYQTIKTASALFGG